jgi:hypothetical protein
VAYGTVGGGGGGAGRGGAEAKVGSRKMKGEKKWTTRGCRGEAVFSSAGKMYESCCRRLCECAALMATKRVELSLSILPSLP